MCVSFNYNKNTFINLETLFTALNIPWDVHVPDEYVMSGNAAILRCVVPVHCLDRIDDTDWLTDEDVSVFNYLGKNMVST